MRTKIILAGLLAILAVLSAIVIYVYLLRDPVNRNTVPAMIEPTSSIICVYNHPLSRGRYRVYRIKDAKTNKYIAMIISRRIETDNFLGYHKYGVVWLETGADLMMMSLMAVGAHGGYLQITSPNNNTTKIMVFDSVLLFEVLDEAINQGRNGCTVYESEKQPIEWMKP